MIYARRGSPVLSAHACAYVYTAGSPGHCQTSRRSAHTITQYVSAGVDVQDGPVVTGRPSNGGKGDQLRHVSIGHESEIKPNLPVLKYNVPILRICTYCHKAPTSTATSCSVAPSMIWSIFGNAWFGAIEPSYQQKDFSNPNGPSFQVPTLV